jgi:hypothetical protein
MKTTGILLIAALIGAGRSYGSPIFGASAPNTGTRTENAGQIVTAGVYSSDETNLILTWNVAANAGNPSLFDYTYLISGYGDPAIGHLIFSLSDGCSADPACLTGSHDVTFGSFNAASNGNSNPLMPGTIDGAKLDFGFANSTTYAFTSDRAPVYGDFYFKGGQSAGWDVGLPDHTSENANYFIARPDTSGGSVTEVVALPEPGTLYLLGAGVVFLAFGRRKSARQKSIGQPEREDRVAGADRQVLFSAEGIGDRRGFYCSASLKLP